MCLVTSDSLLLADPTEKEMPSTAVDTSLIDKSNVSDPNESDVICDQSSGIIMKFDATSEIPFKGEVAKREAKIIVKDYEVHVLVAVSSDPDDTDANAISIDAAVSSDASHDTPAIADADSTAGAIDALPAPSLSSLYGTTGDKMEESTLVALKPLPAVLEPPLKFTDFANDASSCSSEEEISFTDTYLVFISSSDSPESIRYLFGEDLLYPSHEEDYTEDDDTGDETDESEDYYEV